MKLKDKRTGMLEAYNCSCFTLQPQQGFYNKTMIFTDSYWHRNYMVALDWQPWSF